MIGRSIAAVAFIGLVCGGGTAARAVSLAVVNASFETLPAGGLPNGCGVGCSYSSDAIPGWSNSGGTNGQFAPGSSSGNFAYFNYVPDGVTVAYTNGGAITQTLAATAVAGRTYTLMTDFGVRNDLGNPGSITLRVGGNDILATGVVPSSGTWSTYTAFYTATVADAGSAISVLLDTTGAQGDFDNVRVSDDSTVPEPATWGLMLVGFGLVGTAVRRSGTIATA